MRKQLQRAFTLIEMLIAMALTLILVFAVAEFYAYVGTAVRDSRALIEMGGQLRAASQQLHDDLNSLTLRPEPWIDPASSPGYFTVYEGFGSDADPDANGMATNSIFADGNDDKIPDLIASTNATTLFGDGDDVWAGTIRAGTVPFQGRYNGGTEFSQYAEVIWFTCFNDINSNGTWDIGELRFLCRRQLLIRPNIVVQGVGIPGHLTGAGSQGNAVTQLRQILQNNDISASIGRNPSGQYYVRANSLEDLSRRENRFGCSMSGNMNAASVYPYGLDFNPNTSDVSNPTSITNNYILQGNLLGEDRVLSNVLAFDIRVFDPGAPVLRDYNPSNPSALPVTAVIPGDPGFPVAWQEYLRPNPTILQGYGTWVDLYYNAQLSRDGGTLVTTTNNQAPHFAVVANNGFGYGVWDTWPTSYETAGPGTGVAFNGLDDNGLNGVDDPTERQTQPPYAAPLRGVQVRVRIYEPQTRQARQVTVGADFVAE